MIEYYGHNDYRDYYLSHHGVLGMHWGIRRYQPYGSGGYDPQHKGKFVGKNKTDPDKRAIRDIKKRLYSSSKNPLTKDEYESVIRDIIDNIVSKDDIKKMHSLEKGYNKTYAEFVREFKEHEKKHPDLAKLHNDPDMDGSKYWDEMIKKYPNNKLVKLGDKTGKLHSEYVDSVEKMADEVGKILETKGLDRLLKKQVHLDDGESNSLNSYMVGREVAYRVRDDKDILKTIKENKQELKNGKQTEFEEKLPEVTKMLDWNSKDHPMSKKQYENVMDKISSVFISEKAISEYRKNRDEADKVEKEASRLFDEHIEKHKDLKELYSKWDGDGTEFYNKAMSLHPDKKIEEVSDRMWSFTKEADDIRNKLYRDVSAGIKNENKRVFYKNGSGSKIETVLAWDVVDRAIDKQDRQAYNNGDAVQTERVKSRAKSLAKSGYSQAEIAKRLGISTSTVSDYINE